MLENLKQNKVLYKKFLHYLYINVFKKDKKAFDKHYKTLKDNVIIFRAIEFLEQGGVPVLDALNYYSYMYPQVNFEDKLKNLIIKEFYRIENNIECKYIPY